MYDFYVGGGASLRDFEVVSLCKKNNMSNIKMSILKLCGNRSTLTKTVDTCFF